MLEPKYKRVTQGFSPLWMCSLLPLAFSYVNFIYGHFVVHLMGILQTFFSAGFVSLFTGILWGFCVLAYHSDLLVPFFTEITSTFSRVFMWYSVYMLKTLHTLLINIMCT